MEMTTAAPIFVAWILEDDLLLKNAVEVVQILWKFRLFLLPLFFFSLPFVVALFGSFFTVQLDLSLIAEILKLIYQYRE